VRVDRSLVEDWLRNTEEYRGIQRNTEDLQLFNGEADQMICQLTCEDYTKLLPSPVILQPETAL